MKAKALIGKRIQEYRKLSGLTQEELAERVHLTPNYISAVERGCSFPRIETLIEIINCIGVSADQIFCDVVDKACTARITELSDKINALPVDKQRQILSVVETMVDGFENESASQNDFKCFD